VESAELLNRILEKENATHLQSIETLDASWNPWITKGYVQGFGDNRFTVSNNPINDATKLKELPESISNLPNLIS
jgi:hypothetical protein